MKIFILFASLLLAKVELVYSEDLVQDYKPVNATVLANQVNIRAGHGLNFEILGQLNKDASVTVVGERYGWYKIKLPKEALSFVHKRYIDNGVVKANRLRVRAGKGINYNVLGILKKAQAVSVLEEDGDWLRIVPPDNCFGWINKEFLRLSKQ